MVGVGMTDFILNVPDMEFVRGVREGRKSERERIIKLLESKAKHCKEIAESIEMDEFMSEWDSEVFETESKFALELIALIKGENK